MVILRSLNDPSREIKLNIEISFKHSKHRASEKKSAIRNFIQH